MKILIYLVPYFGDDLKKMIGELKSKTHKLVREWEHYLNRYSWIWKKKSSDDPCVESNRYLDEILLHMYKRWDPIETAPKNGTWVMLKGGQTSCVPQEGKDSPPMVISRYSEDFIWDCQNECNVPVGRWKTSFYDICCCDVTYNNPTHWMELPE